LPATGTPGVCTQPPTTSTRICDPAPADGFTLQRNQFVDFIYNSSLMMSGFTTAAGAFGVDVDDGEICGANQVVTADAQAPSSPPYVPAPTATATFTATRPPATATPTFTFPATATRTPVVFSPTRTATATATATEVVALTEICIDGIDNDNDNMVDCGDVDCQCAPIARDPAHLCPYFRGLYRYTIHARVYPDAPITSIDTQGITIALQNHGTAPWFRYHIPANALSKRPVGNRGLIYSFKSDSNTEGLKYLNVRKTWIYGNLQYWINGRALVRAPLRGRVDIEQQVTLGNQPFASKQLWQRKKACMFLSDWALPAGE
jgi:hypothetical protein